MDTPQDEMPLKAEDSGSDEVGEIKLKSTESNGICRQNSPN